MGKKQHQKDKLYLTCSEWSNIYGGKKEAVGANAKFRRLPFSCCSLSLQPFTSPYCTKDGHIFECEQILIFLKKFGVNPITGEKLGFRDLVRLNFSKNNEDKYHCPITFKVFNENTHIVAIKTSGNVFSYEAIDRLNIKVKFWKDLVSDIDFTSKDIITIQDPTNVEKFNFANYFHIKQDLNNKEESDSMDILNNVDASTKRILDELDKKFNTKKVQNTPKMMTNKKADKVNAAPYSNGAAAASFTSTTMTPVTKVEAAIIPEEVLRYERIKTKAYIKLVTSLGDINLELHSDKVPKTCENFLKHCLSGYYNNTIFHRCIKYFMIQGGDPQGTGNGGKSIWGDPFEDETKPNLIHSGRGILSMANSGPNTNKSQFFITFKTAKHLDGKHTVFGRVVGGLEVLDAMEKTKTNSEDRPLEDIRILNCVVFSNPYTEADKMLEAERSGILVKEKKTNIPLKKEEKESEKRPDIFSMKRSYDLQDGESESALKKKSKKCNNFNFSAWD